MTKLYNTIPAGFSQEIDGMRIEPLMYQPTPKGLAVLCAHYSSKYNIDLRCINLELHTELTRGDNLLENFNCFKKHYLELFTLSEGQTRGIILCYKQNHVVPVLITQQDSEKYLTLKLIDSDSAAVGQLTTEHSTSPSFKDKPQQTQLSSKLLLDFLTVITPIAALLVVISLTTENYPMAIACSLIALTGFFGSRLGAERFVRKLDELETNDSYGNPL